MKKYDGLVVYRYDGIWNFQCNDKIANELLDKGLVTKNHDGKLINNTGNFIMLSELGFELKGCMMDDRNNRNFYYQREKDLEVDNLIEVK